MIGDVQGQLIGDGDFTRAWPGNFSIPRNEMNRIVVCAEGAVTAVTDVIGDDPVTLFAFTLGPGLGNDIFGFRGKSNHEPGPIRTGRTELGENVRVFR